MRNRNEIHPDLIHCLEFRRTSSWSLLYACKCVYLKKKKKKVDSDGSSKTTQRKARGLSVVIQTGTTVTSKENGGLGPGGLVVTVP